MRARSLRWNRYVWAELTPTTGLGLLLFTFLLLMNAFFLVAEKALAKNLGFELTFKMFAFQAPRLIVLALPMAILLGTMMAVGRLSADHEWLAVQSAGHGPSRLLRPVLGYGGLVSALCFVVYAEVVPRANYAARNLQGQVLFLSNLASDLRPGAFYTQLPKTVLFVENIRPGADNRLEGALVYRSKPYGKLDDLTLARYGDLVPDSRGTGDLQILLRRGVRHAYHPTEAGSYQVTAFETWEDILPAPPFLAQLKDTPRKTVTDMTPFEIWDELRGARADTAGSPLVREQRIRLAQFELHRRVALPAAACLFAALALSLGVTRARSGKGAGLALSLGVILVYWVLFTTAQRQVFRGSLSPWAGAWLANAVTATWAAAGYRRLRRPRRQWAGLRVLARDPVARLRRLAPVPRPAVLPPAAGEPSDETETSTIPLSGLAGTPTRFIGRLDRYVLRQFVRLLAYAIVCAYLVYTVVEMKNLLDGVLRADEPFTRLLRYLVYALPGMFPMVLPVSCLVAVIVVFALLTRSGELTAVMASGISLRRTLFPVVALTAALCVVLFLVQDHLTPATNRMAEELKDQILGRAPISYGPSAGRWAFGPAGRHLYHYQLYDPDRQVFQGLHVLTVDRAGPRVLDHRFTPEARWDGTAWWLAPGWYRTFPPDGSIGTFAQTPPMSTTELDPPDNFARRQATLTARTHAIYDQLSLAEVTEQITDLSGSGYDTTRLEVAYWSKLAQPVAPLVMVLLGLPFGFRVGRRGSLYGIGVAVLLVIVYWATFAVFNALGLETILPAPLAAWTPNLLYGLLGLYLMLFIRT
jgi:LPS export ABC transporter permease LptG/LPS export ABC transporter permease LptF